MVFALLAAPLVSGAMALNEYFCIVIPKDPTAMESFAAREIRRYLYLRSDRMLPIVEAGRELPEDRHLIVLGSKQRPIVRRVAMDAWLEPVMVSLKAQEYCIRSFSMDKQQVQLLTGGDEAGMLYAVYRFIEQQGVRFYLHGDVLPDVKLKLLAERFSKAQKAEAAFDALGGLTNNLSFFNEQGKPLFGLRGIQPFHDFPEGPDWWNQEDYLAIISQLPKLRMNFIGLHTYPENKDPTPNAEPTVWIGTPEGIGANGQVTASYASSYQNTLRGNWGYKSKKTGEFAFGSANLFERDDFGAEMMFGYIPNPTTPEGKNEVFNRAGALLKAAFTQAHTLGIKTCVGTEIPLTIPKEVRERLKAGGKNPDDLKVLGEIYEGMFKRVAQAYPLDYYWFWTPEGWTWDGTKDEQVRATTNDLFTAIAAWQKVKPPFKLATCGWVLGPQQDRAMFDKVLPKDMPVSCINREVGRTPVEKGFAEVSGRGKWAIPWMEDDPALTAPQLWAGRMRRDAADALRYGCDGLMGIHWRTRVLGPAVLSLARAAWDQSGWNTNTAAATAAPVKIGAIGGKYASFLNNPIADTEEDMVYQTVRYDVSAYNIPVPDGEYSVTLQFCEPNYDKEGKRVFGVKLQGKPMIDKLDIFAKVGKNRALDYTYDHVAVTNGRMAIEFVYQTEYPSIAGIVIKGGDITRKINCGGPAHKDYVADWPENNDSNLPPPPTTEDFYADWALHEFGVEIAGPAAAIFQKIDGKLPRPADWVDGPGGIRPDNKSWSEVRKGYAFVDELEALAPRVKGAGQTDRFNYWLNTFLYMRDMGQLNCTWGRFTNAIGKSKALTDAAARKEHAQQNALPLYREMVWQLGEVYRHLLATVSNPGEMGVVANWEQHLQPDILSKTGEELKKCLGEDLPADARPSSVYTGPTRIIVPSVRTSLRFDEPFNLKVIILSAQPPKEAALHWRKLGSGTYAKVLLTHVARGVYQVQLPANAGKGEDLEYYVRVVPEKGVPIHYPATAPRMNQTLVRQ